MTFDKSRMWTGLAVAGSLSMLALTGCPAPLTGNVPSSSFNNLTSDQLSSSNDAVAALNQIAAFSTDQSSSMSSLASAGDSGGTSTLALGGAFRIQDVTGGYAGGYPTAAPATSSMTLTLAATNSTWLSTNPRTWSWPKGSSSFTYYSNSTANPFPWNPVPGTSPYASEHITAHNGLVTGDELVSPYATGSFTLLPAPFASQSLPSNGGVRKYGLTFYEYGANGSATGYRWEVWNNTGSGWQYWSWNRALQITRTNPSTNASVTIDRWDIADNYNSVPSGYGLHVNRVPYEHIVDMTNTSNNTHWHNDEVWSTTSGEWVGTGSFTDASGSVRVIATTFNPSTFLKTKTVTWTNPSGETVVLSLVTNPDRSGTGTISVAGKQVATLAWASNGKGTITLNGTVKPYYSHF